MLLSNMENSEIIRKLQEKKAVLAKQIEAIDSTIQLFNSEINQESNQPTIAHIDGYDPSWTWKNKIIHILKVNNRFLHIREIVDFIFKYEELDEAPQEIVASFRQSLSSLRADNIIVRFSVNNQLRFSFWGSPNWLDENGQIKKGYEFDPSFVPQEQMLTI